MHRLMIRFAWAFLLAPLAVHMVGCAEDAKPTPPGGPFPPGVELTFAPVELDTTTFRVRFFWNGFDRDGEVVRFWFSVDYPTDSPSADEIRRNWIATGAKDTTLLFLVDPVQEVKQHIFRVVAEDNDGLIGPVARRTFSAKTIPPTSKIERGPLPFNPLVGPNFTYEWSGIDPDGGETGGRAPVDSFEYLLLLVDAFADTLTPPMHPPLPRYSQQTYMDLITRATGDSLPAPHGDWKWKGVRGTKVRFRNVSPGEYVFAIRAVDIAGAREKGLQFARNIRHFTVTGKNPGPTLCISSSVLITPLPCANGPVDFARKALQIFEGEPISFVWTASAESYGGDIVGYTYALDDTSAFPGIDPRNTGVTYQPDKLPPGAHFLFVRVVDDGGIVTNALIPITIVHPAFKDPGAERAVLYVDDFVALGTSLGRVQNYPSDDEEDDLLFFDWMVGNLGVVVQQWDTQRRGALDVEGRKFPDPLDLAPYSTVIWNVDLWNSSTSPTALWKDLVGGNYSGIAGYLRAGGTLILTGFNLCLNTTNPVTTVYAARTRGLCNVVAPGTIDYNRSYAPRVFMGVDGADINRAGLRTAGGRDFVSAIPTPRGQALGYQLAEIDTGAVGSGAKWLWNILGTSDPNTNWAPGLGAVDGWVMAPQFGCAQEAGVFARENPGEPPTVPIYTYHGVRTGIYMDGNTSPREGMVVGIQAQSHDLGLARDGVYRPTAALGRMVFIGFPIYFAKNSQGLALLLNAFNYVNQSPTLP